MSTPRKHLIGLKVLQLSRPILNRNEISHPTNHVGPSTMVELPSSFDVYVGEKFSCLFSIYSEGTEPINVNLKVSISIPSQQEITLIHPNQPDISEFTLEPGKSTQFTVQYEPKESGQHNLTTAISYQFKTDGEEVNLITNPLIKFYKRNEFTASQALDVRGKVTFINGNETNYAFEVEIENVSRNTIVLETIDLLPGNGWISKPCSNTPDTPLLPKDVWQVAYIVSTDPDASSVSSARPEKFMLGWRREPLGERGWLAL